MSENLDFYLKQLRLEKDAVNVNELLRELSDQPFEKNDPREIVCKVLANIYQCRQNKKVATWLTTAGFPRLFSGKEFDINKGNIPASQAERFLKCDWIDRGENLLIYGATGLGKTHFSVALGKQAIAMGYRTKFTSATKLFDTLESSLALSPRVFDRKLQHLDSQNLLIIDDMGNGTYPVESSNFLYMIMDRRHQRGLSTIITSNTQVADWGERLGKAGNLRAALDRFLEMAYKVPFEGDSLRIKAFIERNGITAQHDVSDVMPV